MSVSNDGGKTFAPVGMLGYARDQLADGRYVSWNHGGVFRWRSQLLWAGLSSDFSSGANPKDGRLIVAPITADLRRLVSTPKQILYPTQGAETTNYRSVTVFTDQGTVYLYYQCGNQFFAAKAV